MQDTNEEQSRPTTPEADAEETVRLRPKIGGFTGQAQIKQNLGISMEAANKRGEMLGIFTSNPAWAKPLTIYRAK